MENHLPNFRVPFVSFRAQVFHSVQKMVAVRKRPKTFPMIKTWGGTILHPHPYEGIFWKTPSSKMVHCQANQVGGDQQGFFCSKISWCYIPPDLGCIKTILYWDKLLRDLGLDVFHQQSCQHSAIKFKMGPPLWEYPMWILPNSWWLFRLWFLGSKVNASKSSGENIIGTA